MLLQLTQSKFLSIHFQTLKQFQTINPQHKQLNHAAIWAISR